MTPSTDVHELRSLFAQAVEEAAPVVATVTPADLDRPTPCDGWDVRTLLAHVLGQYAGFARAALDGDADVNAFQPRRPDPDTLEKEWRESVDALLDAFENAPQDRLVHLADLGPEARFPLAVAVKMQLVDTLVHTWDLARGLGRPYRPAPDLAAAALAVARIVPDDESRRRPGAAFAPAVPAPDGADDWDVTLALLGRDPGR